jgi:hypothetical protein
LAWDSFSQLCFVHNDEFGSISLMVHSTKSGQSMYGPDFDIKVKLLGACIRFDLGYINEYVFGPHGVESWLELIKMLRSHFYKDR